MKTEENAKTWNDLVREFFPDADESFADFLLWEKTCFPVGSVAQVREQLRHIKAMEELRRA